jgi:uncharacterized membrane protein YhaH (DUF805 family)
MSPEHLWIFIGIGVGLLVIYFLPITLIIRRTGYSGWWVLLVLVPFGSFVGLWMLALNRWPALEKNAH